MKPDFPSLILTPRTANRIPRTTDEEKLIDDLREHDVNASAFLMDSDLLADAEKKGFKNDPAAAKADLFDQLPPAARDAISSPKKGIPSLPARSNPKKNDDGTDDDGMMDQGKSIPPPGVDSPARKRQREEERRREGTEPGIGGMC